MNDVIKGASIKSFEINDLELEKINKLAIKPLTAEQVFVFKMRLCSNEIDRDFESFTPTALAELAEMFKGKTVISDHSNSTNNQIARIYDTDVIADGTQTTKLSENYTYIEAYVYILRCEKNADFIAEIEAGIKKEVSVGCKISKRVCSVCGTEIFSGYYNGKLNCGHIVGKEENGTMCCVRLDGANDAYEVSFVAVPAQKDAGATKDFSTEQISADHIVTGLTPAPKPEEPPAPGAEKKLKSVLQSIGEIIEKI